MRKMLFICGFLLVALAPVYSQVIKIEFKTFKRGFQKEAFFSADSLIEITNNRGVVEVTKRKIDSLEWQNLVTSLEPVKLEEVPALLSPSSRRTFDGAMHSSITLCTKDNRRYMHSFDDEFPHENLASVMEAIKAIIGENIER